MARLLVSVWINQTRRGKWIGGRKQWKKKCLDHVVLQLHILMWVLRRWGKKEAKDGNCSRVKRRGCWTREARDKNDKEAISIYGFVKHLCIWPSWWIWIYQLRLIPQRIPMGALPIYGMKFQDRFLGHASKRLSFLLRCLQPLGKWWFNLTFASLMIYPCTHHFESHC